MTTLKIITNNLYFIATAFVLSLYLLLPSLLHAQGGFVGNQGGTDNPLGAFVNNVVKLIQEVVLPLLFALIFLMFIYGVFKFFIVGGSNDEEKEKGKSLVIWSIVGLVVVFGLWGIVNFFVGALGFDGDANLNPPPLPTRSGS